METGNAMVPDAAYLPSAFKAWQDTRVLDRYGIHYGMGDKEFKPMELLRKVSARKDLD
jgi:hypothetical protein